jgi:hypothetical protein
MNKVKIEIKESDLKNEYTKASYMNMWAILLDSLSKEEQEQVQKDYRIYQEEMESKQLVPISAFVWGLLNFNIQVGYEKTFK